LRSFNTSDLNLAQLPKSDVMADRYLGRLVESYLLCLPGKFVGR